MDSCAIGASRIVPALRRGRNSSANVLAVLVRFYGRANSFYIPAVPNAGLGKTGALVFEADTGRAEATIRGFAAVRGAGASAAGRCRDEK